jgi:hypothetical protein
MAITTGEEEAPSERIVMKLKWKDDFASTPHGQYVISKSRIRHGTEFQTEYEVSYGGKLIGIGETKAAAKSVAQGYENMQERKRREQQR